MSFGTCTDVFTVNVIFPFSGQQERKSLFWQIFQFMCGNLWSTVNVLHVKKCPFRKLFIYFDEIILVILTFCYRGKKSNLFLKICFCSVIQSKIILSSTLGRGRRTPEKQTDLFLSWSSSRCTTVKCCFLFSWFSIGMNLLNFNESSTRVNQCGKIGYIAALFVWTV